MLHTISIRGLYAIALAILFAIFILPINSASASTVYAQPYIGENMSVEAGLVGHNIYFFGGVHALSTGMPAMGGYWTSTADINKLRVKRISGAPCERYGTQVGTRIFSSLWS